MADTTTTTPTTTTSSPAPAPTTSSPAPAPTTSSPAPAPTTSSPAPAPTTSAPAPAPVATVPATVQSEQDEIASITAAIAGKTEYEKQEIFGQAVEDRYGAFSPRKQAQDTREAYVAASLGDPTRDPVAKQQAMDLTVVQPGAVADAQAVADAGTSSNASQASASHTA